MAWLAASLFAGWLAGWFYLVPLAAAAATVSALLPGRRARLRAMLWLAAAAVAFIASIATAASAPIWLSDPIRHSPHPAGRVLEAHLCIAQLADAVGHDVAVVLVLLACFLWLAAAARFGHACASNRHPPIAARRINSPWWPRIFIDPAAAAPAVTVGLLRPAIIVSERAARSLSRSALGALILHEVSHARFRDNLAAAFLSSLSILFPGLGWLCLAAFRHEAELAADIHAAAVAGEEALAEVLAATRAWDASRRATAIAHALAGSSCAPAVAALAAWFLLMGALHFQFGRAVHFTLVCAAETAARLLSA